jgi:hypothetical protein
MSMRSERAFGFIPLIKAGHIEAGTFNFGGITLVLATEPEGLEPLNGILLNGYDLGRAHLSFHHKRYNIKIGKYTSSALVFDWHLLLCHASSRYV